MVSFQLSKKPIKRLGLLVDCSLAVVSWVNQGPVVIPLDVADIEISQNLIRLIKHMLVAIGVREIQYQLTSSGRWHSTGNVQDPVRVSAIDLRVRVNHFALKPKTKLHAVCLDHVNQWTKALRPYVLRNYPVPKTRSVIPP